MNFIKALFKIAAVVFGGLLLLFLLVGVLVTTLDKRTPEQRAADQARSAQTRAEYETKRATQRATDEAQQVKRRLDESKGRALHAEIDAYHRAEDYVRDRLKAPSTASFAGYFSSTVANLGGGKYAVSSYVDSQNSFGAQIRTTWICTLRTEDGSHFVITNLVTTP